MNVENLRINYPKLISYMEDSDYYQEYIKRVKSTILKIIAKADSWSCYRDVYLEYETKSSRPKYPEMQAVIGAIMQFDLYDKYPDGKQSGFMKKDLYSRLSPEFKRLVDYYAETEQECSNLKEATITKNIACASSFMVSLQDAGITNLNDITEEVIISICGSKEGVPLKSATYWYSIRAVLKVCTDICPSNCQKVLLLIPKIKNTKKNVHYLSQQNSLKVRNTLNNASCEISLRNKAICILAYYTGLRWSDIWTLDLDSIDWERDIIKVNQQQKTSIPLELPLSAIVGNAIYDYIKLERPQVDNCALFLTQGKYHRRMSKWSQSGIASKVMKEAGVLQVDGERKGLHIFRHHLATALLGNEISPVIISAVLGHAAPESVETYFSADIINLRKCALSIARFQNVAEEVFGDA